MRSVVHKSFGQIKRTGKVCLFRSHREGFRDGWQLRDFVYVKDAVQMTLFLYDHALKGIYNIGTGKARSFFDLTGAVFRALGLEPNIEFIDMPMEIRDKYQYFTEAAMGKLFSKGFPAEKLHSLEDAVEDYVKNYMLSSDPYLGKETM